MVEIAEKSPRAARVREQRIPIILKAAETEFARHGFGGATIQGIADQANLPKPNVLYYFGNKEELYEAVLNNIVKLWNSELDNICPEDGPASSLERYIRSKVEVSRKYPEACRIFASEIVHGAGRLPDSVSAETRYWVNEKVRVFSAWIESGRMAPVDPMHLLFMIWGTTQHYADYESQISSIINKRTLPKSFYDEAADTICEIVLRGCGLRT
ncbi:MAG: TetR/AcrR family transcriptional regulator [Endozoicomonas sp.]